MSLQQKEISYVGSFFLVFFLFFLVGCGQKQVYLPTVEKVDIEKYQGVWYEIARYEQYFEKGCSEINATYSIKSDGKINVLNQCMKEGKLSIANGVAYATDASNSKLKVSFFWPFYGNYWIVMLGDNYEYAVIGEPSREYFWILSRTKTLDALTKEKIVSQMVRLGYEPSQLIWSEQKGDKL